MKEYLVSMIDSLLALTEPIMIPFHLLYHSLNQSPEIQTQTLLITILEE